MYAKLSSTITRSSIWREPPATRVVWIALLALANKDGFVKGVEAWLASEANVTREECRAALETFMAEDPESQDQDYGGRRVEKVEGGWIVLNYKKYRDLRTQEQVLAAERQQRKRRRDKGLEEDGGVGGGDVTPCHVTSRDVTAIASASASVSEGSAVTPAREAPAVSRPAPAGAPTAEPEPPASTANLGDRFAHPMHRQAYHAFRRSHRRPELFDASLEQLHAPLTGGAGFPWPAIGDALAQLGANGEGFNVARLRGYLRRERSSADAESSGRPSARGAPAPDASIGGMAIGPEHFWELCVTHGLTAPMQSADTVRERIARMLEQGVIADAAAFEQAVLQAQPWTLLDVRFPPERISTLRARLQQPSPGDGAGRSRSERSTFNTQRAS